MPTATDSPLEEVSVIREADLYELLERENGGPCVSIFLPTSPKFNEADQNRIRFKDLLRQAEQSLDRNPEWRQAKGERNGDGILDELHRLEEDRGFWRTHPLEGIAVFRAPGFFRVYHLLQPVPEVAAVAGSFHVKPLVRAIQDNDRFQVLCVSLENVALYEGDRDRLDPVTLKGVPRTMHESLPGEPVPEGPESLLEGIEKDQRKREWVRGHFRAVDRAFWENHSRPARLPVVLAAQAQYHGLFHEVSDNPNLLDGGIKREPFKDMSREQLRSQAWSVVEPAHRKRVAELTEQFWNAAAHDQASHDLAKVAERACFGQCHTLLLHEEQRIGGRIERTTGQIAYRDLQDPGTDDLLDDLGELVLRQHGRVLVLGDGQMPGETGAAAIFRY